MANKTINIRSKEKLLTHISLELSMDIDSTKERAVRDAFNKLSDEIQDKFEITDAFDLGRVMERAKAKELSQPTPIKQIIDKKKAKTKKLPQPIEGKVVEKAKD